MGQNEFESFQVAVRTASPNGTSYHVASSELPQLDLSWYQVGFVKVDAIYPNTQGGPGWWPDPLLPSTGLALAAFNTTCALWVDVRTADAPPGNYTLTLTLTLQQQQQPVHLRVAIRILSVRLPSSFRLKTAVNLDQTYLNNSYYQPSNSLLHATWMSYARTLLQRFRINPGTIYAPDKLLSVAEVSDLVEEGMNHYSIARVNTTVEGAKLQAESLVPYVNELRAANLTDVAGIYASYGNTC